MKKKRRINEMNTKRYTLGEFHHVYPELRQNLQKFKEYLRMSIETFDYILSKVYSKLQKQWTNFNKAPIGPTEKLVITLR